MLKNYLITACRNLIKQKGYLFINILGMAVGLASFIFISLYVMHERSFDTFHSNYENIYRIRITGQMSGQVLDQAVSAAPMARALIDDYPEIDKVVRVGKFGAWLVRYNEKRFNEDRILFADSNFFDVFDFKLLRGNPDLVLKEPRSIILTESYAKKYFGKNDPIGRSLNIEQDTVFYLVTGIIEDTPENSHFHFDMLASMNSLKISKNQEWISHNFYTYVVLQKGVSLELLEEKFENMIAKYVGPQLKQILGITIDDFEEAGNFFGYHLQPLSDIHLKSNLQAEIEPNGDLSTVNIFSIIAILILIVAIINFINLSSAKATSRAKEVGVRKAMGASKKGLIFQFLGESVLLTIIAAFIAIALVEILTQLEQFSHKIHKHSLNFNYFQLFQFLITWLSGVCFLERS